MQVLIDADNLDVRRLRMLVVVLAEWPSADVVAAGAARSLHAVDWPAGARVLPAHGWQGADLLLAHAYRPDDQPLLLATGDGAFAQLARRHPGPVLLVGGVFRAFTGPRLTITDPADDGGTVLRSWLDRTS